MFAPHCSACGSRVLLGPRRIVTFTHDGGGAPDIVLRCFCGALVRWDEAPAATAPAADPARAGGTAAVVS